MNKFEHALHNLTAISEYKSWQMTPFTIENNVYSTNGYFLLKVPKKKVIYYEECENKKRKRKIIEYFELKTQKVYEEIKVSELKDAINKIPLVDESVDHREVNSCSKCEASGWVEWEYEEYIKEMDCPVCEGTGKMVKTRKEKTENKVIAEGYYISLNKSIFRSEIIETLINITEILKINHIDLISQTLPNKEIIFKIGVCELIIMPVIGVDEEKYLIDIKTKEKK